MIYNGGALGTSIKVLGKWGKLFLNPLTYSD
jgi:hypothetical protein